jgi:hypothetical protein
MRVAEMRKMIEAIDRARAVVNGERPDDDDPDLRILVGVLRRNPEALRATRAGLPSMIDRAMAREQPWRPRRRDRPRSGAPTKKGSCTAAVLSTRDASGGIVMAERCQRHGGSLDNARPWSPTVTAGPRRDTDDADPEGSRKLRP